MGSILKFLLSAILRWVSSEAEAWHQRELRDRKQRKIVKEAIREATNEAIKRNKEIADSPEFIDDSLSRLRNFAGKWGTTGSSDDSGGEANRPLRFGKPNGGRESGTENVDRGDESSIPEADDGST